MDAVITFVTTKDFTSEHWSRLNHARHTTKEIFGSDMYGKFLLATDDIGKMKAAEGDNDFAPFVFDRFEKSAAQLQELWQSKYQDHVWSKQIRSDECFAIIDDQSVRDDTIIIWYQHFVWPDDDDDDDERSLDQRWKSWRVTFQHALQWMSNFCSEMSFDIIRECVDIPDDVQESLTSSSGVFDVLKAEQYMGLRK